jgi:DNA repair exonuclease SbcCD ATPase subunit
MEQQSQAGTEQLQRFQELDSRVSAVQPQLARIARLEQSLEQLRKELVALVEQSDQKMVAAQRESERSRLIEREAQTHAVSELRKQLEPIPQMAEAIDARRTEEQRLNLLILEQRSKLMALQDRVDERVHATRVLEEQRAADAKRIAQLQETTTELLRRAEAQSAKGQLLEDGLRKAEQQIAALQTTRDDLKVQQQAFMEEQRIVEQQRKRQVDDWAKELAGYQKRMTDFSAIMRIYKDFYDKNRHALESLEKLQTHLSQRQAELGEMQRLSEERQKKQSQEWREENEKRWKQESLATEHAWNEQQRKNEAAAKRLEQVEAALPVVDADIAMLWDELSKTHESQLDCLHKRQADLDEIVTIRKKKGRPPSAANSK